MSSEIPLNLFGVEFDQEVQWIYDQDALSCTLKQYQGLWTDMSVKSAMLRASLAQLEKHADKVPVFQAESLVASNYKAKNYTPLMEMQLCPALEDKLKSSSAKRRK